MSQFDISTKWKYKKKCIQEQIGQNDIGFPIRNSMQLNFQLQESKKINKRREK